ncbi:MAG: LytTR family DNA-binding domain-containing protein [Gordonibacter sp.]
MLTIAICEDNDRERQHLQSLLERYLNNRACEARIVAYTHGEQLVANFQRGEVSILLLDVLMGDGMNGIEAARTIKERDPDLPLVFVTSSTDYAVDSYEVRALHYLVKPVTEASLADALDRCKGAIDASRRRIDVVSDRETISLLQSDVFCIEAFGNKTVLHTCASSFTTYVPLTKLIESLGPSFLRCHRSYIVNMDHVARVEGKEFLVKNGTRVPIRTNGRAQVVEDYHRYVAARLRAQAGH